MSASDTHYPKTGEQHHERAIRLGLNWYQGNITKYAERAYLKGVQLDDVIKVLDYATMWLESKNKVTNPALPTEAQREKIMSIAERLVAYYPVAKRNPEVILRGFSESDYNRFEGQASKAYVDQAKDRR